MNSTNNCSDIIPSSSELLKDLPGYGVALLSLSGVFTIITILIYAEELYFLFTHVSSWYRRTKTIWLLGMYPVFTITSFLGIIIPRSSALVDLVASIYLSVCVYQFIGLMVNYYGGNRKMCEALAQEDIKLRSPPLACCCCCCPKIKLTQKNLRRIEFIVLQAVLIRLVLMFIAAVLWTDGIYTPGQIKYDNAYIWITLPNVGCTLTAMYGLILLYRVSRQPLKHYSITPKFILLQFVIILSNLQTAVMGFLAGPFLSVISCKPPFSSRTRSEIINHMLLIVEMLLLCIISRWAYRRKLQEYGEEDDETEGDREFLSIKKTNSYGSNSWEAHVNILEDPSSSILKNEAPTDISDKL